MKKHIARILTAVLMLGLLSTGAGALYTPNRDGWPYLKTSVESTGSITRDLSEAVEDETVLLFPVGTQFFPDGAMEFSVDTYDGNKVQTVASFGPDGVYTLETPGVIYRIYLTVMEMGDITGRAAYIMVDDGAGQSSTPTPSGQAATLSSDTQSYALSNQPTKSEEISFWTGETAKVYSLPLGTTIRAVNGGKIAADMYYYVPGTEPDECWNVEPGAADHLDSFTLNDWKTDHQTAWATPNLEQSGATKVVYCIQTHDPAVGEDYLGTDMYLDSGIFVTLDAGADATPETTAKSEVSSWAKEGVAAAEKAGLIPELTGAPGYQDAITREQFAELVFQTMDVIHGGDTVDMLDVEQIHFSDCDNLSVRMATSVGVVNGVGDGKFEPKQTANREQIAVMVARAIDFLEQRNKTDITPNAANIDKFSDKGQVSAWAVDSVGTLSANGIMTGTSDSTLSPKDSCTVEQSILLLYRVYQLFVA